MARAAALAVELLAEARRVLEGPEASTRLRRRRLLPAPGGGEDGGGTDETSEEEGLQAAASLVAVHATILGVIVCTFGDLLLDVVVRLARPLVPGDDAGELVSADLARRGVEVCGPVVEGRTGVVVSIAEPGGERTMASDRGVGSTLAVEALEAAWFACDAFHVSGYSLLEDDMAAAAVYGARAARSHGASISVDLATWSAIGDVFRRRLGSLEADVVFGGQRELDELGEVARGTTVVRKLGSEGVELDGRVYPSRSERVVDSTGAGDALAAGFLVGGIELGLQTAARCVAKLGAMP